MIQLVPAYQSPGKVRELFSEYTEMLIQGDPGFKAYLSVQNYEDELKDLEKKYGLPDGRLYLCYSDENLAGCIGLKKLDKAGCEMKRLYVRPQFRGQGIGGMLIRQIIRDAEEIGYHSMFLDTLPFLKSAIHMYKKYGFYEIESYNNSPMDTSIYMRLDLRSELTAMRNIGKEMEQKLKRVGIDSAERLKESGSRQAFLKLKEVFTNVCLVHLYALEGAVQNVVFNSLSEETKKELKEFSDYLKG